MVEGKSINILYGSCFLAVFMVARLQYLTQKQDVAIVWN